MEYMVCIDGAGGEDYADAQAAITRAVELKNADPDALVTIVVDHAATSN